MSALFVSLERRPGLHASCETKNSNTNVIGVGSRAGWR